MRKYFYTNGTDKFGPFTLEELKEKHLIPETLVWFQGLGEWQSAGSIPELNQLFNQTPPPVTNSNNNQTYTESNSQINIGRPPKTWLIESIIVTILCCLPFGIIGIIKASKVESRFLSGNIDEAYRLSASAKSWVIYSVIGGIIAYVLILLSEV